MSLFFNRYQAALRWLPALFFAIAIFNLSSIRGDEVSKSYKGLETSLKTIAPTPNAIAASEPKAATSPPTVDWVKAAHGFGYFWLGGSVLFALSSNSRWSPSNALILCCLYSITDEIHQSFIPKRSASLRDVIIDTLGALIGVAIMLGITASRRYFASKNIAE